MESKKVLIVKDLVKNYQQSNNCVKVLNSLTLCVERGERVSIMGSSGSGKTTLLNLLGGLDDLNEGTIHVCSKSWSDLSVSERAIWRNKHVGFVYQFHHLLEEFSAAENVALPLMIAGQSREISLQEASGFLGDIGLSERLNHRPSQLSGGERQRVAVARSLITKPSLLLMDEPTGNLDSESAKVTLDLILQLNKSLSTAIVLVTHDSLISSHMDTTYKLFDGKLEKI